VPFALMKLSSCLHVRTNKRANTSKPSKLTSMQTNSIQCCLGLYLMKFGYIFVVFICNIRMNTHILRTQLARELSVNVLNLKNIQDTI